MPLGASHETVSPDTVIFVLASSTVSKYVRFRCFKLPSLWSLLYQLSVVYHRGVGRKNVTLYNGYPKHSVIPQ